MRFALLFFALVSLSGAGIANAQQEPPAGFDLTINGKKYQMVPGKKLELELDGKTTIEVAQHPTRRFENAGIGFAYPTQYDFEYKNNDGNEVWTLDGSNVVVLFFSFPDTRITHRQLAENAGTNFDNAEYTPISVSFGEAAMTGTRMIASVSDQLLCQEYLEIPSNEGARIIVIQDSLNDSGKHNPEFVMTKKTIEESFQVIER